MKNLIFLSLASTFTLLAFMQKPKESLDLFQKNEVPGIVFIADNWGIDQTEVTNFSWLEYLVWIQRIYGSQSEEYLSMLPDTTVWEQYDDELKTYTNHYLRHSAYRNHPVVGISYEQMTAFCEWRSNRVLEYALVKAGELKWSAKAHPDSVFTLANYYAGKIPKQRKALHLVRIPHYHLPTKSEWEKAAKFADLTYKTAPARKMKNEFYSSVYWGEKSPNYVCPDKKGEIQNALYNMHRNVSEQLFEKEFIAGENWSGKQVFNEGSDFLEHQKPSATLGFRCAFNWESN